MASEATNNKGNTLNSTDHDGKSNLRKQGRKQLNQKCKGNFGKQNKNVQGEIEELGNNVYFYGNHRQADNFDVVTKRIFGYIRKKHGIW